MRGVAKLSLERRRPLARHLPAQWQKSPAFISGADSTTETQSAHRAESPASAPPQHSTQIVLELVNYQRESIGLAYSAHHPIPTKQLSDARRTVEMTFDQALEALKDAWIERCLSGRSARLNARLFAARQLIDSHPEFDRRRYDAAFDDANRIVALHRRILQTWSPK